MCHVRNWAMEFSSCFYWRCELVVQVNRQQLCHLMYLASILSLCCLAGCGGNGNLASVQGNVTLDGTPLEQGSIVFEPENGDGPVTGGTIVNGKYQLEGSSAAQPGQKIVRINASRSTGRKIEAGPPSPPGTMVDEVLYVPVEYNEKSKLRVQLDAGKSTHDFTLESK